MTAPTTCLGVAGHPLGPVTQLQCRITRQRGQPTSIRREELQFGKRYAFASSPARWSVSTLERLRDLREFGFELAAEHIVDAEGSKPFGIERRVEAVRADPGRSI